MIQCHKSTVWSASPAGVLRCPPPLSSALADWGPNCPLVSNERGAGSKRFEEDWLAQPSRQVASRQATIPPRMISLPDMTGMLGRAVLSVKDSRCTAPFGVTSCIGMLYARQGRVRPTAHQPAYCTKAATTLRELACAIRIDQVIRRCSSTSQWTPPLAAYAAAGVSIRASTQVKLSR